MISSNHLNYLQSVNNLSIKNIGLTGKNPSVACLIVDYSKSSKGIILSYGLTSKNGRPHAEINALNKLSKKMRDKMGNERARAFYLKCINLNCKNMYVNLSKKSHL